MKKQKSAVKTTRNIDGLAKYSGTIAVISSHTSSGISSHISSGISSHISSGISSHISSGSDKLTTKSDVKLKSKRIHPGYNVWDIKNKSWTNETFRGWPGNEDTSSYNDQEEKYQDPNNPESLSAYQAWSVFLTYGGVSGGVMVCALDNPGIPTVVRKPEGWVNVEDDPKIEEPWYKQRKRWLKRMSKLKSFQ